MSIEGEIKNETQKDSGGRTLGEAANRYVTFQIWASVIGLGLVGLMVLFVVLICGGYLSLVSFSGPGN